MDDRKEKICGANLYQIPKDEYGELYKEHLLEQYKLCIQSLDYTSKLKHTVNKYFLTINMLLITAAGLSLSKENFFDPSVWHSVVPVVGILICIIWWASTRGYKLVNLAKFEMLHCIEQNLPLAIYKTEWEVLKNCKYSPYRTLTAVEPIVPWVFGIFYILIFFFVK